MILVTLGTQDKDFSRLLEAIEKEIKKGNIQEEVIVQAGHTKFSSDRMKIFDFISAEKLEEWIESADLIITHGGVSSIMTALKHQKKIIAAARLHKYKEHTNDHQVQIIKEFEKKGYLLELRDFNSLGKLLKKVHTFHPKKYTSKNEQMIELVDQTIINWKEEGKLAKGKRFRELFLYLIFGGFTTIINIVAYFILARLLMINYQISTIIAWILSVLFAFITNKLFVFESKNNSKKEDLKEMISFFSFRILSLGLDMVCMYLMVQLIRMDDLIAKIIANVLVVIANYIFSKLFIFKK